MKRFVAVSAAVLMMCSSVMAGEINVKLNGEAVEFSSQEPVVIEGRTLIPLRGVFEKLGYEIEWDNKTKTAVFKKADTEVKVTVNADSFDVNGEKVSLDVPAQIVNGSMMLPLRAVGEATGLEVDWDSESKTVSLKSQIDDNNTVLSLEELENSMESDDVEFKFDKESGMATIKPRSADDLTTEKETSERSEEKEPAGSTAKIISFTEEEKATAENYIIYTQAVVFGRYYLDVMGDCNSELNSYNYRKDEDRPNIISCLEKAIEINSFAREGVKKVKNSKSNNDIITAVNNVANKADDAYKALLKNYKDERKNPYTSNVTKAISVYNNATEKLVSAVHIDLRELAAKDLNENSTEFNPNELQQIKDYQKQVGEILNKYFKFDSRNLINSEENAKSLAEKLRNMREDLLKVNPPEKCRIDTQALVSIAELAEKSAENKSLNSEDENEKNRMYYTSLIMTFDICAKKCAGEYYNSYLLG